MEFLELSIENLKKENEKLYNIVVHNYDFDCVIFIARGAYLIGKDIAEFKKVPLLEVFATRKGGKLKKLLRPILQIIPSGIKKKLREKEFNSNVHEKNIDRNINYDEKIWSKYKDRKKILIVDDSVDTGYSMLYVRDEVQKFFESAEVKVAALNCFEKSSKLVKTNFYLYKNSMLKGPWSNDSKENKVYLKAYSDWHDSSR